MLCGLQKSIKSIFGVGYENGAILKAVSDAAPSDAWLEHVWETFLESFDEVVAARVTYDQANGITTEFDPLPVSRALNRMDAGVLIHAFGAFQMAKKDEVLSAIMRVWISTLYPFDEAASIGRRSE